MKEIKYNDKEKVLLHLINKGNITIKQAAFDYDIWNLPKIIYLLRKEGCNIENDFYEYINQFYVTKIVIRYFIRKKTKKCIIYRKEYNCASSGYNCKNCHCYQ
jgi:hypothetical protein